MCEHCAAGKHAPIARRPDRFRCEWSKLHCKHLSIWSGYLTLSPYDRLIVAIARRHSRTAPRKSQLFDHLVGTGEQQLDARSSRVQIYPKIELGGTTESSAVPPVLTRR
jgi:hypothetical protein